MTAETAVAGPAGYPVRFDVEYPEGLSRWLIFVKWLLAIPHALIIGALGYVVNIIDLIAFFAILFTKKYPRGLFNFRVNVHRWTLNFYAYAGLLRDEYPPFSWEAGQYPVTYEVDYPEELNRWLPLVKWLLAIPHYIVLLFVFVIAIILWIVAFFAILFTASIPRGIFDFLVGTLRWYYRVSNYVYFMRDEYPPFSLK